MNRPVWMDIELTLDADTLQVSARGSRMEWAQHRSGVTLQELEQFTQRVGRAVQAGTGLDADAREQARALHHAILQGKVAELAARLREAAPAGTLLQRLMIRDGRLQAVPWEALCGQDGAEDFWGVRPETLLARGADSSEPWEPREIRGAVKLLAIAPSSDERALHNLQRALKDSIDAGEIEWLDPIVGARAGKRYLFEQLSRSRSPHILHFLGHGGVRADQPVLLLGDDQEDDDAWITAETLARELELRLGEDLRLVVLEACEGARPGTFGSAAEILARRGTDAVVAHLWPVRADVARTCSRQLYQVLAGAGPENRGAGDVAASVVAARSSLLGDSAEAFSPVLYLRGTEAKVFDFPQNRRVSPPSPTPATTGPAAELAPALRELLQQPFSLILGDNDQRAEDRAALREQFLKEEGDPGLRNAPLGVLAERCLLRSGQEKLSELFQEALVKTLDAPCPRLVSALARVLRPGVHVTLLWRPLLESAVASQQPGRTIHVIQPQLRAGDPAQRSSSTEPPRVFVHAAGSSGWEKRKYVPGQLDLDADIVILRLYGGYPPERPPIFTSATITEDDHIHGLLGLSPPEWSKILRGWLCMHPALFANLSVLQWQHRMLLHWLYGRHPAPENSVAVLDPAADSVEQDIWQRGGGLPSQGQIATLCQGTDALADALDASALEAQP